jgi:bacterioferritin
VEGNSDVIEMLNDLLASELAAINTYFLHAKILENDGYPPLAKHAYDESIAEMRHAERLTERILYFETVPNLQRLGRVRIGATVTEQYEQQLDLERSNRDAIAHAITLCRGVADDGTRLVLEPMLTDGEGSIDWLETQLGLINALGEAAYLAQHIRE